MSEPEEILKQMAGEPLTVTFEDNGQRHMVLLALGELLARRPGWVLPITELAEKLQGKEMMEEFRKHVVAYTPQGETSGYSQPAWNAAKLLCDGCYITGNPTRSNYIGIVAHVIEKFAIKQHPLKELPE